MSGISLGNVRLVKATAKALLVATADYGQVWVPKSVIDDDSEVYDETTKAGNLVVFERFAEEKGWA